MRVFTGLKMGSKMGPEHRVKGQEVSPKGVRAFLEKPKATFFKKCSDPQKSFNFPLPLNVLQAEAG